MYAQYLEVEATHCITSLQNDRIVRYAVQSIVSLDFFSLENKIFKSASVNFTVLVKLANVKKMLVIHTASLNEMSKIARWNGMKKKLPVEYLLFISSA